MFSLIFHRYRGLCITFVARKVTIFHNLLIFWRNGSCKGLRGTVDLKKLLKE
jgi:hypothetical protein